MTTTNIYPINEKENVTSYNPKIYAQEKQQAIWADFAGWLKDLNYCYRVTASGTELYSPTSNKSFTYHSELNVYAAWKKAFKVTTKVKYDDNFREFVRDSIPNILDEVFDPSSPSPYFTNNNQKCLNFYKPFQSDLQPTGNLDLWHEFMERLFRCDNERVYCESFFAHIIQKPEERPTFGLMFTSQQGTGKGKLCQIMTELLSGQVFVCSSFEEFTDRFSIALHNTLLCQLDDVVAKSDKQMSTLKSKITEPKQKFEAKNNQAVYEKCYTRMILASNERRPLRLDNGDRRWYLPEYMTHKVSPDETADFISKLDLWLKSGGYVDVYEHLKALDISSFNPNKHIATETLKEMIGASKTTLESDLEEYIKEHPAFCLREVYGEFSKYPEDTIKAKLIEFGCNGIGKELKLLRYHPDQRVKNSKNYVFYGDKNAAFDYLVAKATNAIPDVSFSF